MTYLLKLLVAFAVAFVPATPLEAHYLLGIVQHESQWRADVVFCGVLGKIGERGAWQVLARNATEAKEACTLIGGAAIALTRVRESLDACGDLTGYVSGHCGIGVVESRARMGTP